MNTRTLVLASCILAGACTDTVTEYRVDPSGKVTSRTLTSDESWKQRVEHSIDLEVAGNKPPGGQASWEVLWRGWYENIRKQPGPPWKPSEFKTSEDMVRYMKARLVARGLPAYD